MPLTDQQWLDRMWPGEGRVANAPGVGAQPMGLFDDLGDIYTDIDRDVFGGWLPGGSDVGGGTGPPPGTTFGPDTPGMPGGGGGGPGVPPGAAQIAAASCNTNGPSPVWKKVCGVYKWVIPKRRRRRALLTEGDYNSLLRIEGLKVNKNMTAAIAKALTR